MNQAQTPLVIREALPADEGKLLSIIAAVFIDEAAAYLSRSVSTALTEKEKVFVAACDERTVGFMLLRHENSQLVLDLIAVDPEVQCRGYGRQMLMWLIATAKRWLKKLIKLSCAAKERAQNLYRRLGFKQVFRRERAYANGDDALVMTLGLRSA